MLRTRFIHPLRAKSHRYRAQTSPAARVWFFDLDNTIHDASHAIFEQISLGMVKAVMQHLHIDAVAAKQLCERYLSLIHISEPTRRLRGSRMPSSA